MTVSQIVQPQAESEPEVPLSLDRSVILVGLMGAGKSRIGKRLAERLGLPFIDTDHEIEVKNERTIAELFALVGESKFRDGERLMIAQILDQPVSIIAAGGGAFLDPATRARIRDRAISVWLRADLDTLVSRTARSNRRPLLEGVDRRAKLAELMEVRYPIYGEAHLTVDSLAGPVEQTVDAVIAALRTLKE
jgi:shikimate kinase